MGSSKEMEKLWIHGALNVCVNDQSEITVELEGGGGMKKRGGGGGEKYRRGEESRRKKRVGDIFRLTLAFPLPSAINTLAS